MSPEQALGEPVDRRTDVFALGIILYQLTTGKHPFRGESDLVTLQNIVSDKPIFLPRALDKQYPKGLEALVMKALDRNREARFQTCAELESAIDEVFGKELPRARTEDVAKFMREMLGSRGESRRKALVESIRVADERAAGRGSYADVSVNSQRSSYADVSAVSQRASDSALGLAPAEDRATEAPSVTVAEEEGAASEPNLPKVTPYGATIPAPYGVKRAALPVAAAAIAAVGLGVVAFVSLRGTPKPPPEPPPAHAAAEAPVPTPPPPEPPAPAASSSAPVEAASAAPEPELEIETVHAADEKKSSSHHVKRWVPPGAPKPEAPTSPTPPPKSGFVPPPVSNPGF
jgi:serine/threonine-protein kinase